MSDTPDKPDDNNARLPENGPEDHEEAAASAPSNDVDRTIIRSSDEGGKEEQTPSPKTQLPYVVVVQGPRMGTRFHLSEEKNIVGRSPGCAVRLDDQSVSRQHAEIASVPGGWSVKDLGSKNGTVVNQSPVTEPVIIGHKDLIKTGIYLLRLISQVTTLADEMTLPPAYTSFDSTVMMETPPAEGHTSRMPKEEDKQEQVEIRKEQVKAEGEGDEQSSEGEPQLPVWKIYVARYRRYLAPIGLGLIILVLAVYLAHRFMAPPEKSAKKPENVAVKKPATLPTTKPSREDLKRARLGLTKPTMVPIKPGTTTPPPTEPGAQQPTQPGVQLPTEPSQPAQPGEAPATMSATPSVPPAQKIPVFLDFVSSPLPATIVFDGKELGKTPLRVNLELEPNRSYEAEGTFQMPEVNESYVQRVSFTVEPDKSIIPLLFRGPIGILKINELPRDAQFYLEGVFEYDRFKERPAKISEVVLRKPIYLPFGKYTLELRRARQLGASETYVQDIIFRREFTIAADNPSYMISVTDEDLKIFPVTIRSEPPNADVYIDGKKQGTTPYKGDFPLGKHTMTLRKEGYFEHSEKLEVDMNTPFATMVKMQTSVAGQFLNLAQAALNRAMYSEAINQLAQALSNNPAPGEVAKANFMLGVSYLSLGDVQRAASYFDMARQNDEQRYPATLGLVQCYAATGQVNEALPLLVEVMLNAKDEDVKREANGIFQKLSPFKSIVYVYTTPEGATVTVNDKQVAQPTPVIIHDLPLGTYKVHVEKPGYLPQDLRLQISVNEFNPVIIELKPIPQ